MVARAWRRSRGGRDFAAASSSAGDLNTGRYGDDSPLQAKIQPDSQVGKDVKVGDRVLVAYDIVQPGVFKLVYARKLKPGQF